MAACGLSARRRAVRRLTACDVARSVFDTTSRSARMTCFRASTDHASVSRPPAASTTATTTSTWNSPPSARSVANVCRIGPGSASPLVSITIRLNWGNVPCVRSATRLRSAFCRSERMLQHRQPLPSSVTSSLEARTSASSMPTLPNSLMMTAVPSPAGLARKRRSSVVLPATRKPVTTVTGFFAQRARLSLRPKGPASREGKRSSMTLSATRPRARCAPSPRFSNRTRVYPSSVTITGRSRIYPTSAERVGVRGPCYRGASAPHPTPLPVNTGRGSRPTSRHACIERGPRSKIHLQDVEAADVAVDGVDDLALVDEHVVELDGAGRRHRRRRRHENADLLRLVGIGDVVGAQPPVEEGAEHDLIGLPGGRPRHVLVDIVRAEAALGGKRLVIGQRASRDRD